MLMSPMSLSDEGDSDDELLQELTELRSKGYAVSDSDPDAGFADEDDDGFASALAELAKESNSDDDDVQAQGRLSDSEEGDLNSPKGSVDLAAMMARALQDDDDDEDLP